MNQRQNANIGRTRREEGNNKRDQDNIESEKQEEETRTEKCKPKVGYGIGWAKSFLGFLMSYRKMNKLLWPTMSSIKVEERISEIPNMFIDRH